MPRNYRLDILFGIDNIDESIYGYNPKKFINGVIPEAVQKNISYHNVITTNEFLSDLKKHKKMFYLVDFDGKSRRFVRH